MKKILALMAALISLFGCSGAPVKTDLQTVQKVDLGRYMGLWHEIARLPAGFQEGCVDSRATYSLRDDGTVSVLNECERGGKTKSASGTARVVDSLTNAKLEVSFFRPFWGDYWIIDLPDDYRYVVVSEPRKNYLWILAREKNMDEVEYQKITASLAARGFDISRLIRNSTRK